MAVLRSMTILVMEGFPDNVNKINSLWQHFTGGNYPADFCDTDIVRFVKKFAVVILQATYSTVMTLESLFFANH